MTMRIRALTKRDSAGRLEHLEVLKGKARKGVELQFIYGADGFAREVEFTGKKEEMPSIPDIIALINEKFMERLGTIKMVNEVELIDLITKISEITTIKTVETIESLPNIVVKGSEGLSFKQSITGEGAWVSPTSHSDADSDWINEENAYDRVDETFATTTLSPLETSGFLELILVSTIISNKLKFYLAGSYEGVELDVDAKVNGTWINVYQGGYVSDVWIEKNFSEGSVDRVRFRFKDNAGVGGDCYINEVYVWQTVAGGELTIKDKATATTPAIYNVTMTNANTEYSQALSSNTKRFSIKTRDGTAFRVAFETGKVATPTEPYETVPANSEYYEDALTVDSLTLYFACGTAAKIVEIVCWS